MITNPWHDHIRQAYAPALGRRCEELVTPALLLDLKILKANLATMADHMKTGPVRLRPHMKGTKCVELARLQVEAGAIGVCTATVWEAIVMSRAGIEDVLIANEVGGGEKIRALAAEARTGRITVAVDHPRNATELNEALAASGGKLEVLIEIDVGMGRGGVRSLNDAVALARHIGTLPHLRFRGMQGYEGHCMLEPDPAERKRQATAAVQLLVQAVDRLAAAGFACEVVSAGGTGTYNITGMHPRVTELQAGAYIYMDNFHGNLVPGFAPALTVLGTVVIRHGNTIVLDAGRKSVGIDYALPTLRDYPFYTARFFAEEHALFDIDERCQLQLGDTAALVAGYAPTTVNLHDVYYVIEDGRVVDLWPVFPRGPGHVGLLTG